MDEFKKRTVALLDAIKENGKAIANLTVKAVGAVDMEAAECKRLCKQIGLVYHEGLETRVIQFRFTDGTVDRDGDIIKPEGVDLEEFKKEPTILSQHNSRSFPIGKSLKTMYRRKEGDIVGQVLFFDDEIDPTGISEAVFKMVKAGALNTGSIGFSAEPSDIKRPTPEEREELGMGEYGLIFERIKLLEFSIVTIPANPNARQIAAVKAAFSGKALLLIEDLLDGLNEKGVIPHKKYPLADENSVWDAGAEVRKAEVADLKLMCTWFDSENSENKTAYKLPHHKQADKNTVWKGVSAAMNALLGGRGGVDIPEGDRKGVYNHLSKHYKEFDKEPPEFKEAEVVETPPGGEAPKDVTIDVNKETITESANYDVTIYINKTDSILDVKQKFEQVRTLKEEGQSVHVVMYKDDSKITNIVGMTDEQKQALRDFSDELDYIKERLENLLKLADSKGTKAVDEPEEDVQIDSPDDKENDGSALYSLLNKATERMKNKK